MVRTLRIRLKLWRLEASTKKIRRAYERDRHKLVQSPGYADKLQELRRTEHFEMDLIYDEIAIIKMDILRKQADALDVLLPIRDEEEDSEHWRYSHQMGVWILTTSGRNLTRARIRTEQGERTASLRLWLPVALSAVSAAAAWFVAFRK